MKEHFIHLFGGGESQSAEHSVVLRNRQETSRKLGNMAKVLSEIGGVLGGAELVVSASNSLELAGLIAVEHCSKNTALLISCPKDISIALKLCICSPKIIRPAPI